MTLLLTEISKYLITLVMLIYTAECFLILYRAGTERSVRGLCTRQTIFLFALQALFFTQIIAHTGNLRYLAFYVVQLIVLVLTPVLFTKFFPDCSRPIINNMCMLLMIGMTVILRISSAKAVRQMIFVTVSIAIGMLLIYVLRRNGFPRQLWVLYASLGAVALGIVLVLGATVYGSRINYTILGFTFQPSEFVKILFVLFLSGALYQSQTIGRVLLTGLIAAAHVLILVLSRDLGSALIFFVVYICMVFIATGHPGYLIGGILLGVAAAVAAYYLFGHVRSRVLVFLDPWATIDSNGYQIAQSLFSISAGIWLGRGLFLGRPSSIPFVEDDVVFSAIAEELGLIFAMAMLMVCLSTFLLLLQEALQSQDSWCRLLTAGIAVTYLFQVFLTVGGGTKFIPLTGVTLPFVSYGGSSVLSTILMFCLFEGVSRQDHGTREPSWAG
ncbi:MAG: FtsW/RodA/SpoVE family cell cycle protein [Lachnospiraceae bacterium]|nr:FtsW/RodA/SpoVE family cell cycle protein [Lachnospiraceae bacterium]